MPPQTIGQRREFDDDDDFDIRKRPGRGGGKWLMWLAVSAVALVLLSCLIGGGIYLALSSEGNATAAKLHGSWQGQFVFGGQAIDAVYVFEKGGGFRQDTLDARGQVVAVSKGRWRVFMGKVEINWDNRSFEDATVTWTDDNTMQWHIVDHNDEIQIGTVTTMRRRK